MLKLHICRVAAGFIATLGLIGMASAQQAQVSSTLQVERVVLVDAKPVLKPVTAGQPGDVLEYRASYDNHGDKPANGFVAELPIPAGTTYVAHSAQPANALASTDGVHFAAMPLMRMVKMANGTTGPQPVPLADYRALRWSLGNLLPGKQVQVQARVQVDPVAAATATPPAKP